MGVLPAVARNVYVSALMVAATMRRWYLTKLYWSVISDLTARGNRTIDAR